MHGHFLCLFSCHNCVCQVLVTNQDSPSQSAPRIQVGETTHLGGSSITMWCETCQLLWNGKGYHQSSPVQVSEDGWMRTGDGGVGWCVSIGPARSPHPLYRTSASEPGHHTFHDHHTFLTGLPASADSPSHKSVAGTVKLKETCDFFLESGIVFAFLPFCWLKEASDPELLCIKGRTSHKGLCRAQRSPAKQVPVHSIFRKAPCTLCPSSVQTCLSQNRKLVSVARAGDT